MLLILLGPNTATASHGTASGQSFTFLEPGFDQEIVGVFSDMNFMGGIAFAPDGDVWVNDCNTSTHLHRYDIRGVAPEVNGTKLHPESIVESDAGCGMTNHPDGLIYSNTGLGVVQIDAATGAPTGNIFGPPGNSFGIAPDPQTGDLVYAGRDCDRRGAVTDVFEIITVDPATGMFSVFTSLGNFDDILDGLYFGPSGSELFLAMIGALAVTVIDRDLPGARTGTFNRDILLPSPPDGIAFHQDGFLVSTNTDGTISKIVPGPPDTVSVLASGGGRNDLSQVGPDNCLYTSQDFFTRYDDGTVTGESSVVRICPDFIPSPGVGDTFEKELVDGPDEDGDGEIDVVVDVGQGFSTVYAFKMTFNNATGQNVLIKDTVPAEWTVTMIDDAVVAVTNQNPIFETDDENMTGLVSVFQANKKANTKSATKILWNPDANELGAMLTVELETRVRPNRKFAPTSCGPLFLNSGPATVFELEDNQKRGVLFQAAPLCLAAVENPSANPGDRGPEADTDGDGFPDLEEACALGSDPCLFDGDADGDTVPDSVDNCPFAANPNQTDGDGNGVGDAC